MLSAAPSVEKGEWSSVAEKDYKSTIACDDRLFKLDNYQSCISENGECVLNVSPLRVYCSKSQGSGLVEMVVVTSTIVDLQFTIYEEQSSGPGAGSIVLIVIAIIAAVVLGVVVAFVVLKKKKGITFGEFITCRCWKKLSNKDERYEKMDGQQ